MMQKIMNVLQQTIGNAHNAQSVLKQLANQIHHPMRQDVFYPYVIITK